jgi:hypothetical protein
MQGVKCNLIFAQDHTHEVTKNYIQKKKLGIGGLWDVATETGEIACAVLVPSTKTSDFSHAATQLAKRSTFNPQAMYSDTWPCKNTYWEALLGHEVKGRLGLFHYIQRITRTLRKNHVDYFGAVSKLLHCVYFYNNDDYDSLLGALKDGSLSSTNTKYTDDEIAEMKNTRLFRQRYDKYLRKEIRHPNTMQSMLDNWFSRYKCTASGPNSLPAFGRLDPVTQQSLFTAETKDAWRNCREKAEYLQDPLPLTEMYYTIPPNPNSKHGLNEYLSRRGESSLESFHCLLAHFANCGMRSSLADNLNLTGTARYNLAIRHKLHIASRTSIEERRKMPSAWETVPPYHNHTELSWINEMAKQVGVPPDKLPFPKAEPLSQDTGERFFSEYLDWIQKTKPQVDADDRCLCHLCEGGNSQPFKESSVEASEVAFVDTSKDWREDTVEISTEATNTLTATTPNTQTNNLPPPQQQYPSQPMPVPYFVAPPYPPWFVSPTVMPQRYCCNRYRQWLNQPKRRGRPPHEWNCIVKLTIKSNKNKVTI